LAIASDNAQLGQVGPRVGSVDPGFGTALLARVVGEKKAREIWYLCRRYTAQQTLDMGLVNAVVPQDQLDAEVRKWCDEILEKSPTAIALAKKSFNVDTEMIRGMGGLAMHALKLYYETHVPYRGAAPALQDVMANQVDYVFDPGIAFPHVRSGKVRMLAVAGQHRSSFFPDVPTLAELGFKGAELDIWFGMWAPNGTSAEVIARLNTDIAKALTQASTKTRYEALGSEPVGLDTPAFKKLLTEEGRMLSTLIKERKIVLE
jgi:tripartite-type tricarboxylate transporter receptor subunit TctC